MAMTTFSLTSFYTLTDEDEIIFQREEIDTTKGVIRCFFSENCYPTFQIVRSTDPRNRLAVDLFFAVKNHEPTQDIKTTTIYRPSDLQSYLTDKIKQNSGVDPSKFTLTLTFPDDRAPKLVIRRYPNWLKEQEFKAACKRLFLPPQSAITETSKNPFLRLSFLPCDFKRIEDGTYVPISEMHETNYQNFIVCYKGAQACLREEQRVTPESEQQTIQYRMNSNKESFEKVAMYIQRMREIKQTDLVPSIKLLDQFLSVEESESKDDGAPQPGFFDKRSINGIFSDFKKLLKNLHKMNEQLFPKIFAVGQLSPSLSDQQIEAARSKILEIQGKLAIWNQYPQFLVKDTRSSDSSLGSQKFLELEGAKNALESAENFLEKALTYRKKIEEIALGIPD